MSDTKAPLGLPDGGGSGEPYDTGKDVELLEQTSDKSDKGGTADDKGGEGEGTGKDKGEEISSVDDMLKGERGKDEGEIPPDEDEDLDEGEDKGEDEGEGEDGGEGKGKEKEEPEPPEPTEDDTLHNRPNYSAVKKAYPDIFKKFPELRAMLFREPEFSKLFPTVKEAKTTADYADNARQIELGLMQGDSTELLKGMHMASPAILTKFAENLPAAVYEVSQESYVKMTTPIIRNAVILARQHARGSGDKDLWNGLDHLEKFLFGDPQFSLKKKEERAEGDPLKEEREQLDKERKDFQQTRYREFEGSVVNRSQGLLKRELLRGLDPQNSLTPRMRDMLVAQAVEEITGRMEKDNPHLSAMNQLWRRAAQAGLSKESEEQLVRAWLSRARPLIGPVRRKLLTEVIGRGETKGKGEGARPPRVPTGRERGSTRVPLSAVNPTKVDFDKTSDADIFDGKVTLRK